MPFWNMIKRTGRRRAGVDPLEELEVDGASALVPDEHYFRVSLAQMHLADESTFLSHWLPGAHVGVTYTRQDASPVEYSKVLRPDPARMAAGARLNFAVTDLVPYRGGVLEIEAALFGLQTGSRLDLVVDVLQAVSGLALPAVGPALEVASRVTAAAKSLVEANDGVVHLNVHQSYVSAGGTGADNVLRPLHIAAMLATDAPILTASLRVVNDRLHVVDGEGAVRPLVDCDFLLLKIEGRPDRDDFWLPELELLLSRAITALRHGDTSRAENYREDALSFVWDSPALTWVDRERVAAAATKRFDVVASARRGASAGRDPQSLRELVDQYGPGVDLVLAEGPSKHNHALR